MIRLSADQLRLPHVRDDAAFIAYHGTATGRDDEILDAILAIGLARDPGGPYTRDTEGDDYDYDEHTDLVLSMDDSFDGVYLTRSFRLAETYAANAQAHYGGNRLYIVALIDPVDAYVDEDVLFGAAEQYVDNALAGNSYQQYVAAHETVDWDALSRSYLAYRFDTDAAHAATPAAIHDLGAALKHLFLAHLVDEDSITILNEAEEAGEEWFELDDRVSDHVADHKEYAESAIALLRSLAVRSESVRVPALPYEGESRVLAVVEQNLPDSENRYTLWYEAVPGLASKYFHQQGG